MRTGVLKWTNNERALAKINDAYEEMGFERWCTMSDSHTRMIISLFSHNFVSGDICYSAFNKVINQRMKAAGDKLVYDEELLSEEDVPSISEWLLIPIVMHVASENEELLARLRRDAQSVTPEEAGMLGCPRVDTQASAAFMELACPIKHAIFNVIEGLQELCSSHF